MPSAICVSRKTFRSTHRGELWGLLPTGNPVQLEFIDIFRIKDGQLAEHWLQLDVEALRNQLRPAQTESVPAAES